MRGDVLTSGVVLNPHARLLFLRSFLLCRSTVPAVGAILSCGALDLVIK